MRLENQILIKWEGLNALLYFNTCVIKVIAREELRLRSSELSSTTGKPFPQTSMSKAESPLLEYPLFLTDSDILSDIMIAEIVLQLNLFGNKKCTILLDSSNVPIPFNKHAKERIKCTISTKLMRN